MPTNFGDVTLLVLTAGEETPQDLLGLVGLRLMLTPAMEAMLPAPGVRDTLTADDTTVPGYLVEVEGGLQWVIAPVPDSGDAANLAMLDALPGAGGWRHAASRQVWLDTGAELLARGVSGPDLRAGFPALFAAARQEFIAQLPPTIRIQLGLTLI